MKLAELEPVFLKREIRTCRVGEPDCSTVSPHEAHEYYVPSTLEDADGIMFLCPKCYIENKGEVGTHRVLCWRPRVPADVDPKPGRWEFAGTCYEDLSRLLTGRAHVIAGFQPTPPHP